MKMTIRIVITFAFFWLAVAGCKENSSGTEENETSGNASFSLSGDLSGQKAGTADFDIIEILDLYNVIISVYDVSPQTYTIEFALVSENEIVTLEPGSYDIGETTFNGDLFTALYIDTENNTDYSTFFGDYEGTLTITESTEEYIEGTFEFSAGQYDNESGEYVGEITISNGEFSAVRGVGL